MTLSPRQLEVAALLADGLTPKGVGRRLGISRDTVLEYVERAARRLPAGEGSASQRLVRWFTCNTESM